MSGSEGTGAPRAEPASGLRHWLGFLASGLIALAVDATVLEIGVRLFALDPLVARLGAISTAMVAGWLAHRRLTFAITAPATLSEFARYVAAAWVAAAGQLRSLRRNASALARDASPCRTRGQLHGGDVFLISSNALRCFQGVSKMTQTHVMQG